VDLALTPDDLARLDALDVAGARYAEAVGTHLSTPPATPAA